MQELDRFNIYCLLNYYSSFCSQHIYLLGQISQIVIVCYFTGLDEWSSLGRLHELLA